MINTLKRLASRACFEVSVFFTELKNNEDGLSGVVVAVLLILVSVLAIALIWGNLQGWLGQLWDNITQTASSGIS